MVETALGHIASLFQQIEAMIQDKFLKNISNENEIKKVFKQIKEIMEEEIEANDIDEYNHLKYVFHSKSSAFYKVLGLEKEATNHEKLAQQNEKYVRKEDKKLSQKEESKMDGEESKHQEKPNISEFFAEAGEKDIQNYENEAMANLELLIDFEAFKTISDLMKLAKQKPNTFDDFQEIRKLEVSLENSFNELNLRIYDESQNQTNKESLAIIQKLARHWIYTGKAEFTMKVLGSPDPKVLLFGRMLQNEEEINKKYKELVLCFHPDKASWARTEEDREFIYELCVKINEIKNSLIEKFEHEAQKVGKIDFYEEKGHNYWGYVQDYRNASKGDWSKLKILKKQEISNLTPEELKNNAILNASLAYAEYRACCRVADQKNIFKKKLEMRRNLALCRFSMGMFLEAQLYAISCFLIIMDSKEATIADLTEAKKIFEKVKYNDLHQKSQFNLIESSLALVKMEENQLALRPINEGFSYKQKEEFKTSIEQSLRNVSRELVLRSDRTLIRYDLKSPLLITPVRQKEETVIHLCTGGLQAFNYLKNPTAMAIVFSIKLLLFKDDILKKKHSMEQEAKIRDSLGNCIISALAEYDKGNMEGFMKAITQKIDEKGQRLFRYEDTKDTIVPDDILEKLLDHGMRPDGAAYILN